MNVCPCGSRTAGVAWPMATDGDDAAPFVERCDECAVFASDDDAAQALIDAGIGVLIVYVPVHDDGRQNGWQPAVYPHDRFPCATPQDGAQPLI